MVREDYSGKLVSPVGDGNALGATMRSLLSVPDELPALADVLARLPIEHYGVSVQAGRYQSLYQLFFSILLLYCSAREYCRI